MATPYLGEIRMVGFNFAPIGWAFCNGQLLPIAENEALFSLLGTTYGGDGVNTFGLPNLQSRLPIHWGRGLGLSNYVLGEQTGIEDVTLTVNQMPAHIHTVNAVAGLGNTDSPQNAFLAVSEGASPQYSTSTQNATMNPQATGVAGGSQPHTNIQPVLAISFIIALEGIYPSQS